MRGFSANRGGDSDIHTTEYTFYYGVSTLGNIIQFGVFDESDDYALVQLGKKWMKVPCWLACQWDTACGGIYGIVRDYGLEQMTIFRPWEYKAMDNMRNEARAMRRYYLYGDTGVLTDVERRALNIEADTRQHHPHLRGDAMYEPSRCAVSCKMLPMFSG